MAHIPLYQRVKERIRTELLDRPDSGQTVRLPTERELEALFRVSRPTIGKALAALAAEGLVAKAQGRGSFALPAAPDGAGTRTQTTKCIGYVAPLSEEALVKRAFRGIDRAARRGGYQVLMSSSGFDVGRERDAVEHLISAGAQGVLIYPVPRVRAQAQEDYLVTQSFDVPLVLIDTCLAAQGHTQVVFDNTRAGYAMTNWLLDQGNRRIAIISYGEDVRHGPLECRLDGYLAALRDRRDSALRPLVRRTPGANSDDLVAAAIASLMDDPQPPTAIIAPEDMMALDIVEVLSALGLRVPDDVCVVGFDNRQAARRVRPPITTTNPDFERMGEMACALLLDEINSPVAGPRTYLLEVPILVRGGSSIELSTTPAAAAVLR